eukprot:CAMPEP_0173147282 /NCGR_PEP_ID=MMETSP1105-20130129/9046_1 /TAXON_ID=2985 /ORGANISM="Ochromonas sp., Strain BG-1" /LENGTH=911 /DNA_ID=CAMNT_0014061745 /DNA_START=28 /DNA_END=2763 /DNA_ORIENTATION=+
MATGSSEIYFPSSEHEKNYFDYLWDVANNRTPSAPGTTTLTGELSGLAAVTFFQRSGVDKGFLKQIWSLSTPVATMNAHQFYVALRFIAMIQNGEMPISRERLLATVKDKFELPRFNGIDVPVARPVAPVPTPQPVPTAIPPNAAAAAAAFAITPQEHVKYHSLFVGYDKDKDGFLSREEAVPVFRQSGLDERAVDQIWLFADDDRDNRLTSKEFSAAFHIIVCVSKRGQPFPTALPPSLKMFLLNAPAIPGEVPAALPPAPVAVAAAPLPVPAPVPVAAPVEVKKLDISSAFSGFDDAPLPAPSATPAPVTSSFVSASGGDDAELRNSLDAMKAATKKTVAAHEQAVEIGGKAYSSLQGIKQRLATDRIALEATVANAIAANNESNTKLELISQEIFQLQEQIRQLTQRLQEAQQSTSSTQSRVAKAQEEKQQLLRDIDQLLKQLDHSQSDSLALTDKLSAAERDAGRLEAENKALNLSATSLRNNSAALAQENDELRRIASSLRERVGSASSAKQNLSTRLTLATDKVTSLQTTNQQLHVTVQQETKKQEVLKEEHRALLNDVTPSSSSSGPAVAVSPRFEEDSLAFVSTKTLASSTTSNTFDDTDDPFGGFDTDNKSVGTGFVKLEEETVVSTKSTVSPVPVVPVAPAVSPAPARSPVPAPAPVVATAPSTVSTAFDTSDPFGGFGDVSNAPLTSSTTAEDPFESAFSGSDVADPFGGDAGFDSLKSTDKLSAVASPVGAVDPFGGFDSLPSASPSKKEVTTPVSVQVADDPFAGFDDNVPLPKTASLSPVPSKSQKDPFADFDEPAPAPVTSAFPASPSKADSDPFSVSVSAAFGDDKEDPFASFNDASDKVTSDPFGGFDAPTTNKAVDDAFGSSAFGDASDDPFGTTSVNQKKATDEDDPFAGFD